MSSDEQSQDMGSAEERPNKDNWQGNLDDYDKALDEEAKTMSIEEARQLYGPEMTAEVEQAHK